MTKSPTNCMPEDKYVIVGNFTVPTKTASEGTKVFMGWENTGGAIGCEHMFVLYQSRGGRWIGKWEQMRKLDNFRLKTIPPASPFYDGKVYKSKYIEFFTDKNEANDCLDHIKQVKLVQERRKIQKMISGSDSVEKSLPHSQ